MTDAEAEKKKTLLQEAVEDDSHQEDFYRYGKLSNDREAQLRKSRLQTSHCFKICEKKKKKKKKKWEV